MKPKYPIYVISKGRYDNCLTADFLIKDGTPFKLVVEPQEKEQYAKKYGEDRLYILPFSNLGLGSIPARNWVKEHATKSGAKRHWILDDNIRKMRRKYKGKRIICNSNLALAITEEFVDRYENIAVAGLNYTFFVVNLNKPFFLNGRVYSCILILNSIPNKWRGRYNEDTDLCLQVLADGWCTILMNIFTIDKMKTMSMKGGNTDQLYAMDGRLRMARSLERQWPGVVEVYRRFQRPQHKVKNFWQNFDTQLKRRKDIDWENMKTNEFGMKLTQNEEIKSPIMKKILEEYSKKNI